MRNSLKKIIVALSVSLTVAMGVLDTSASYYLSGSDRVNAKITANNMVKALGTNYCGTTRYEDKIRQVETFKTYFNVNSRDYAFAKEIISELKKKCVVTINNNNNYNSYNNGCAYDGCGNVQQNNVQIQPQVQNYYNNGCQYNGCTQRIYKKGYYITKKNGIEIRRAGNTMYLYDGNRLILTYALSWYESTNFNVEYFGGNRNIFVITKADKYGKCIKWIYNRTANTIAKIRVNRITKVKKDYCGNYYFVAKIGNQTTLYKYNGRVISKKYTGVDIVDYTPYRSGVIKIDYYNSYGYLASKYIR